MSSYTKYHRAYYSAHKTEIAERTKKWVTENRKKYLQNQKKYNLENRGRSLKRQSS